MNRISHFKFLALALSLPLTGMVQSQTAPPPSPTLIGPNGSYTEKAAPSNIQWSHADRKAQWYQVYIQRNGIFYTSAWVQVERDAEQYFYLPNLGRFPTGEYQYWVQGWEPSYGSGPWSPTPGNFTVTCDTVNPPSLTAPADNHSFDGSWPRDYIGSGNTNATWSQIEIYRDGVLLGSQWVQNEISGNSIFLNASIITGFDPALVDDTYTWRLRQYSPCHGIGEWSEFSTFTVSNTNCLSRPDPLPLFSVNMLHYPSGGTAGESNQPIVFPDFGSPPGSWAEVYISSATTGVLAHREWLHFSQAGMGVSAPFLPADTYYIFTRRYNRCGLGNFSMSNPPPEMITVTPKDGAAIQNLEILGYDCNGTAYTRFDSQVGIDWYEYYAACDGSVLSHGWTNANDLFFSPVPQTLQRGSSSGQLVSHPGPCGSTPDIWVRAYGNGANAMGEWTQAQNPLSNPFVPTAPTMLNATITDGRATLTWQPQSPIGDCEVYIQKDGIFYGNNIIQCTETGPGASNDHPQMSSPPSEWVIPYDLSPGCYEFWVRQTNDQKTIVGDFSLPYSCCSDCSSHP